MMNQFCFEAFDQTMRDLTKNWKKIDKANSEKPFGRKVVVLDGDFRQIMSVVRKGSWAEVINATTCS